MTAKNGAPKKKAPAQGSGRTICWHDGEGVERHIRLTGPGLTDRERLAGLLTDPVVEQEYAGWLESCQANLDANPTNYRHNRQLLLSMLAVVEAFRALREKAGLVPARKDGGK